jgi:hypothetical protein
MSDTEAGYQGWTNHATWATNLWLTNTEPYYRALHRCKTVTDIQALVNDIVARVFEGISGEDDRGMVYDLAADAIPTDRGEGMASVQDRLDDWYGGPPALRHRDDYKRFARGLVNDALSRVNWQEILEAALEE